jgi:hypothetical protein
MPIIEKVVRAQGEFAKKGEDIIPGDTVTIKSPGEWITGDFGEQFVIKVATRNGDKNVRFNQTNLNILHDEFGKDTTAWIGKSVVIRMKKDVVAGKKVDIYYFVTPDWDFDEYRELVKKQTPGVARASASAGIDYPEENINVDDIPF